MNAEENTCLPREKKRASHENVWPIIVNAVNQSELYSKHGVHAESMPTLACLSIG